MCFVVDALADFERGLVLGESAGDDLSCFLSVFLSFFLSDNTDNGDDACVRKYVPLDAAAWRRGRGRRVARLWLWRAELGGRGG